MYRRRFCLQKGGSQEHIFLITIMFEFLTNFNDFFKFSHLILGSAFRDCVIFYGDILRQKTYRTSVVSCNRTQSSAVHSLQTIKITYFILHVISFQLQVTKIYRFTYGCFNACSTVNRFPGLNCNNACTKSKASAGTSTSRSPRGFRTLKWNMTKHTLHSMVGHTHHYSCITIILRWQKS